MFAMAFIIIIKLNFIIKLLVKLIVIINTIIIKFI